jgi:hypothetical protein
MALRASWIDAYKAYQYVAIYGFGKARRFKQTPIPINKYGGMRQTFRLLHITTLLSQFDKQGFPALDYLINGLKHY